MKYITRGKLKLEDINTQQQDNNADTVSLHECFAIFLKDDSSMTQQTAVKRQRKSLKEDTSSTSSLVLHAWTTLHFLPVYEHVAMSRTRQMSHLLILGPTVFKERPLPGSLSQQHCLLLPPTPCNGGLLGPSVGEPADISVQVDHSIDSGGVRHDLLDARPVVWLQTKRACYKTLQALDRRHHTGGIYVYEERLI